MSVELLPLDYRPGDGYEGTCDLWTFAGDGWVFDVWCEGVEWMGFVRRADGSFFKAYAYPSDARMEDVDPTGTFQDTIRPSPGSGPPTPFEIGVLNRMKEQIFEHRTHQITTGRTTK